MLKTIPIGTDDFKKLIEENFYYVDKTLVIEELLNNNNMVSVITRPKSFGKSLFISMLDNFFNIEKKESNKDLFKDLKISKSEYYKYLSNYPVIKLDFKSLKQNDYENMYSNFKKIIKDVFASKEYLKDILYEEEKEIFNKFINSSGSVGDYQKSIKLLSNFLYRYYNKKVIILIDNYDAPLRKYSIFHKEALTLLTYIYSSIFKDNDNLKMGIMCGIYILKESGTFSGFNNAVYYGIFNKEYNEYFGFTENETKELLEYYNLKLTEEVKNMYDGYNFNGVDIYNPWSILNYANRKELVPYWVNTSGNELIMDLIRNTNDDIKIAIENLIQGKELLFTYDEKVTFLDLNRKNSLNMIINFFLQSGYLTLGKGSTLLDEMMRAVIPNNEVKNMFANMLNYFLVEDNYLVNTLTYDFRNAFLENDKNKIEAILNKIMLSVSFYDTKENFYHGYMLGLFTFFLNNSRYILKSNREAGSGRFDIMIESVDKKIGIIIELKITNKDMENTAKNALKQMKEKEYYKELLLDKIENIYEYSIVFKGKKCIVR